MSSCVKCRVGQPARFAEIARGKKEGDEQHDSVESCDEGEREKPERGETDCVTIRVVGENAHVVACHWVRPPRTHPLIKVILEPSS